MAIESSTSILNTIKTTLEPWCYDNSTCTTAVNNVELIGTALLATGLGLAALKYRYRDTTDYSKEIIEKHEFQKITLGAACGVLAIVAVAAWSFALIQLPTVGLALAGCGLAYLCAVTVDKAITEDALAQLR